MKTCVIIARDIRRENHPYLVAHGYMLDFLSLQTEKSVLFLLFFQDGHHHRPHNPSWPPPRAPFGSRPHGPGKVALFPAPLVAV